MLPIFTVGGGGIYTKRKLDFALRQNITKNGKMDKNYIFMDYIKKPIFFENTPMYYRRFAPIQFFQLLPILALGGG